MKIRWARGMLLPVLVAGALAGCDGLLGSGGDDVQRAEYRSATERWEDASVQSYSYVLTLVCSCAPAGELRPVRVTVRNGAVVSRVYESNDPAEQTPAPEAVFGPYDTVEELFAVVQNSIGRDADLLNVAYHPAYGVPILLQYDRDSSDPDDNLVFQVAGFAPETES